MQTLRCSFNKTPCYSSIKSVFCWHDFAFSAKGTSSHLYEDKVGRQFCVHQLAFDLLARIWSLYIQNLSLMTDWAGQIFTASDNNVFSTILSLSSCLLLEIQNTHLIFPLNLVFADKRLFLCELSNFLFQLQYIRCTWLNTFKPCWHWINWWKLELLFSKNLFFFLHKERWIFPIH